MSIANASQTRLAITAESSWGVTPTTPTWLNTRFTSGSLNITRQTVTSDEIRPDRNVADLTQVAGGASGDINIEWAYGGTGSALDLILESFAYSTWGSNVIKNGVVQKSLSIEKTYETGGTDVYLRFTGMVASTLSMNLQAGQKVTGSIGFMGAGGSTDTAAVAGATYTAAPTGSVMNCTSGFAGLTIAGLTSPRVRTLSFQAQNGLREQAQLGSFNAAGIGAGRFQVTGSCEVYLEDRSLIDQYLSGTATGITFTVGEVTGEKYTISFPTVKWSDVKVAAGGNDQDVMVQANWTAIYDSGSSATMTITRAVA